MKKAGLKRRFVFSNNYKSESDTDFPLFVVFCNKFEALRPGNV